MNYTKYSLLFNAFVLKFYVKAILLCIRKENINYSGETKWKLIKPKVMVLLK